MVTALLCFLLHRNIVSFFCHAVNITEMLAISVYIVLEITIGRDLWLLRRNKAAMIKAIGTL